MVTLPQQPLSKATSLLQVGLGASVVFGEQMETMTLKDRIRVKAALLAIGVVLRYISWVMKDKIQITENLTEKLKQGNIQNAGAKDYQYLRTYHDDIVNHLKHLELTQADNRLIPQHFIQTLSDYRRAYTDQLLAMRAIFAQLDVQPSDMAGFTSIKESKLWKNRSKAYDYLT